MKHDMSRVVGQPSPAPASSGQAPSGVDSCGPHSPWLLRAPLWVVARLAPFLARTGLDPRALALVLEVKIKQDLRRPGLGATPDIAPGSRFSGGLVLTCGLYFLAGIVLGALAFVVPHPLLYMSAVQALVMIFVAMVLIVDFTSVLLDPADLVVLVRCPVSERTLFAARLIHVVIYLWLITGALSIGPLIMGSMVYPAAVFIPLYLLSTSMSAALAVLVVVISYQVALHLFDPERFKDAIVILQVVMTIVVFGGYHFVPELLRNETVVRMVVEEPWWLFLCPPCYYGGLFALGLGQVTAAHISLSLLGLLVPATFVLVVLELAARGTLSRLASGATVSGANRWMPGHRGRPVWVGRGRFRSSIASLLAQHPAERAGYELFFAVSRRDRQFKLRVYPMLAFPLFFIAIFLIGGRTPAAFARNYAWASLYLVMLYVPAIVVQMRYSQHHDARWVFDSAPQHSPGLVVRGALRALEVTYMAPYLAVMGTVILLLGGLRMVPDAVLAVEFVLVVTLVVARHLARDFPFTRRLDAIEAAHSIGVTVGFLAVTVLIASLHMLVRVDARTLFGSMAVLAGIIILLERRMARAVSTVTPETG